MDRRANWTYCIYRLADVEFVKKWKGMVNQIKNDSNFYPEILRGIFAGEGNIKHYQKHNNSRSVRIASGKRNSFIEKLLLFFDIVFKFDANKRAYWITGRHLEKLNELDVASLHPEKEAKFRKMINSLKEKHFSPGELKLLVFGKLDCFWKTSNLANFFKKSDIRILEVLRELKKENKVDNIKMKSGSFWIKKELKDKYLYDEQINILNYLNERSNVSFIGKKIGLSRKVVRSRLVNYQSEGLVRYEEGFWRMTEKGKTICGIDESGSEF